MVNLKRGLIRLWLVFSALWAVPLLGITAPDWYRAIEVWHNEARVVAQSVRVAPAKPNDPWASDGCSVTGRKCFDVTAPNGSRYVVRTRDTDTDASVASMVRHNLEKFNEIPQGDSKRDWNNAPYFVDFSSGWMVIGDSLDLGFAPLLSVLAFAIPLAVLAVGYAVGWVLNGFSV